MNLDLKEKYAKYEALALEMIDSKNLGRVDRNKKVELIEGTIQSLAIIDLIDRIEKNTSTEEVKEVIKTTEEKPKTTTTTAKKTTTK